MKVSKEEFVKYMAEWKQIEDSSDMLNEAL